MLVTLTEENGSKKRIVEIGYIQVGKNVIFPNIKDNWEGKDAKGLAFNMYFLKWIYQNE